MDLIAMLQSVPHALGALQLDDSTVSVLAMLGGIIGGWTLTGLHQKQKAQKIKVTRKQSGVPRRPE
jgi:hypothetical protein